MHYVHPCDVTWLPRCQVILFQRLDRCDADFSLYFHVLTLDFNYYPDFLCIVSFDCFPLFSLIEFVEPEAKLFDEVSLGARSWCRLMSDRLAQMCAIEVTCTRRKITEWRPRVVGPYYS